MKLDHNYLIKVQVNGIYERVNAKVKDLLLVYEKSLGLEELTQDQQIEKIHEELIPLLKEKQSFKACGYAYLASYQEVRDLFYYDNFLFVHDHEEEKMFNGLLLHGKIELLKRLLSEYQLPFPLFTYERYERSERNPVFYLLHLQPFGTTREDYRKMRSCQRKSLEECVFALCKQLRENFTRHSDEPQLLDQVEQEVARVRMLLDPGAALDDEQFVACLGQLIAMRSFELPQDAASFHRKFLQWLDQPDAGYSLSPDDFRQCRSNIAQGRLPDTSVVCLALERYEGWLNDILYRETSLDENPEAYYDKVFLETCHESDEIADREIEEMTPAEQQDAQEDSLDQLLHQQKEEWDKIAITEYLQYADDRMMLKYCFRSHCMKTSRKDFHREQLQQALVTYRKVSFLESELTQAGRDPRQEEKDIHQLHLDVLRILLYLLPGKEQLAAIAQLYERAIEECSAGKPVYYVLEDYSRAFTDLFKEACKHVIQVLDTSPTNERILFACMVLKEIEHMELMAELEGKKIDHFYQAIKKLLSTQLFYLSANALTSPLQLEGDPGKEKKKDFHDGANSFNYNGPKDFLLPALLYVYEFTHFVATREEVFYVGEILMARDFTLFTKKVHLTCKTNLYKCIIYAMKHHFKTLTNPRIERCNLFVSDLGNPITATNMTSESFEKIMVKKQIMSALRG